MAGSCKVIGVALVMLGIVVALTFSVAIGHDEAYRGAALAAARNPGNVMYDAEFKGAQVRRAFELVGVIAGILLALNGTTLLGLGIVAGQLRHITRESGSARL